MIIKIKVKAHSGKQEVNKIKNNEYLVYLKSVPENNKANVELIKLLKGYFKKEVKIKTGLHSKIKTIEVND